MQTQAAARGTREIADCPGLAKAVPEPVSDCPSIRRPALLCQCSRPTSAPRSRRGGGTPAPGPTPPRKRPRGRSSSAFLDPLNRLNFALVFRFRFNFHVVALGFCLVLYPLSFTTGSVLPFIPFHALSAPLSLLLFGAEEVS